MKTTLHAHLLHQNEAHFHRELHPIDTLDEDIAIEKRKQSLVRQIVRDLPSPCNELLWAFYRDGFSMKTMAEMFHYKSESAAKVTKHRCTEKFRARFEDLVHKLF